MCHINWFLYVDISLPYINKIHLVMVSDLFIYLFNLFQLKDNCFAEVVFCQIPTWISHRYTYVPSLPSSSLSHPCRLLESPCLGLLDSLEFLESVIKFALALYFIYGNVSFHVTVSIHLTLSFLPFTLHLFSVSVSPDFYNMCWSWFASILILHQYSSGVLVSSFPFLCLWEISKLLESCLLHRISRISGNSSVNVWLYTFCYT